MEEDLHWDATTGMQEQDVAEHGQKATVGAPLALIHHLHIANSR